MKIALGLEYKGSNYKGWQRQSHCTNTVQEQLENSISYVAATKTETICAGRTDSGVHASCQVVHFETTAVRDEYAWLMGINTNLPDDIKILWVKPVAEDFHARYSAIWRSYSYFILNDNVRSGIFCSQIGWCGKELDLARMQLASKYWIGEHDFTSFRASSCQSKTPIRDIKRINIERIGFNIIRIDITANAFLQHMVRNLVGSLIEIGVKNLPVEAAFDILQAKDRKIAPATAMARGLYLTGVGYPCKYQLPKIKSRCFFMNEEAKHNELVEETYSIKD